MSFSPVHARSPGRRGPSPAGVEGDTSRDNINTIFVGNLGPDSDEAALREFFGKYGYITQVKVVMDQETGKPRGFGFVTFEDVRDAQDAVSEARGKSLVLDGNTLRVNVAKYPRGGLPHERFDRRQGPPMRGRGMGRYNSGRRSRSRSLGRYSPGRYSPGRYSPNTRGVSAGRGSPGYSSGGSRSRSRSASRGRSGSPLPSPRRRRSPGPPARNPGWVAPPQQVGRPLKRRAGRSPSPSGSYSSHGSYSSYSSSGSEGSRRPPAAMPPLGPANAAAAPISHASAGIDFRSELAQAKRKEAEASTRVAALEAKLKSSSSGFGELQASVQDLTHRLQKQEETCSHYRKWLSAMAECAKALTDSKAAVASAEADVKVREEDLAVLVGEAATFVEKERARANKRARRHRDGRPRDAADGLPATLNGVIDGALQQQSMMTDAPEAVQPLPSAAEAGTGWAEQGMHIDGQGGLAQHDDMVAAKFKPGIKFKLGM